VPIFTPVAAPAQVYTAGTQGTPHAFVYNTGGSTLYLGGNLGITQYNGFPLGPGMSLEIPVATQNLFAVAGITGTGTSTTTTAAANAGATSITLTASLGGAGTYILLGTAGSGTEIVLQTAGTTTATVTALNYDHHSGATAAAISGFSGSTIRVDQGAT
jgi:hypothetical protein